MGTHLLTTQHLFIGNAANLLEGWRQAFPSARCISLEHARVSAPESEASLVWLRLSAEASVAEQIAAVRRCFASNPLVVLSDIPSDMEALAVFALAARGYCNVHAGKEVLQNVASVVAQGGLWIGESIMQRLLAAPMPVALVTSTSNTWAAQLTERELEVAKAVARGGSNKEIAAQLGVTERTIKAHVGAIFEKLKLRDRLQLALFVKDS